MKKIFAIIIILLISTACEEEVKLNLDTSLPQIVIEGNITDEKGPYYVKISQSVNFYSQNQFPKVKGAIVTITDNLGNTDTLTETEDGLYQTNTTVGVPGNTYNLAVTVENKKYYATSTMPEKVNLDSIIFKRNESEDGFYTVVPVFKNPETGRHNYRFIVRTSMMLFNSYFLKNSFAKNGLINNEPISYTDGPIEVGAGSELILEMRCIDLPTYTYFNTLTQIADTDPGGGVTPINPPNNITGEKALGIFSAYTTQTKVQPVR